MSLFPTERVVPGKLMSIRSMREIAVLRTEIYQPGAHPLKCPVFPQYTAVCVTLVDGSTRYFGFEDAWIGPDLRTHVSGFDERNEIIYAWPRR